MEARELSLDQIDEAKSDADAAATVCAQYKGLVIALARKFFLESGELDDLVQEGMIGLFKAIGTFDKTRGAAFSTFATMCVKAEIISAIRRASRQKDVVNVSLQSSNLADSLPSSENEIDRLLEYSQHEERMRGIKRLLSTKENEVLELYLKGLSYAQMAAALGTNAKSVENSIKRIREKLRDTKYVR